MNDSQLISTIDRLVQRAIKYRDQQSQDRADATDYYNGDMERTLPVPKGHSTMVSKDVRAAINKVMPSVCRTLLSTPNVFEFEPMDQEDEESSKQATEYINYIAFPESDGATAVKGAIHDACLLRNGIVKVHWQVKTEVQYSEHTGLDEMDLGQLIAPDNVEVIEQSEDVDVVETEQGPIEVPVYSVKIKRTVENGKLCTDPVALENFLILEDAIDLDETGLIGSVEPLKLSDLIAMGYDREKVMGLPLTKEYEDQQKQSRDDRVEADEFNQETYSNAALREVDYYELYVRIDRDGDGLSELLRCCFGGEISENTVLSIEEWDEHPFVDFKIEEMPHQWQGVSIADDVMDLQKLKTSLWRETLNNIYWQNKPQPIIQDGSIEDEDAILNPVFGKPIRVEAGRSVRDALGYTETPFVAKNGFDMMGYVDEVIQDRTGISEASSGMAPDALQNMTAKASAMIEAAGIGRTESMVRTIAKGMKCLGKKMLKLVIQHQDKPRTVRLRNEWRPYDPRQWNASMDVSINTGLGAGTRERDMMMLQLVLAQQEKLLAELGPINNPYVSAENLYNTLEKMTEAAGFPTPEPYFTEPNPETIQQKMEEEANRPNPEMLKIQGQMQLEQAKMAAARDKEMAQMEADLKVKDAEIIADTERQRVELAAKSHEQDAKLQSDAILNEQKLAFEREKLDREEALEREKMSFQAQMKALEVQNTPQQGEEGAGNNASAFEALAEVMRAPKAVTLQRDENGDIVGGVSEPVLN